MYLDNYSLEQSFMVTLTFMVILGLYIAHYVRLKSKMLASSDSYLLGLSLYFLILNNITVLLKSDARVTDLIKRRKLYCSSSDHAVTRMSC
jgi:hypothetical protein